MNLLAIHELIERLGNLLRVEARQTWEGHHLQPVQLEALHYLSICNRYSDTPLAVAEYLGLTKGTTSQTLKVLETRGLIQRKPDTLDRRVVHLEVSAKGKKLVEDNVPALVLRKAAPAIPEETLRQIEAGLKTLLYACQQGNQLKSFGACHTCRHNQKTDTGYFCQLTQEPLSHDDVTLICREHNFPTAS